MFWDVRLDKLLKKGNKRVDEADVVWKPMHVVHLLSVAGELGGFARRRGPAGQKGGHDLAATIQGQKYSHWQRNC